MVRAHVPVIKARGSKRDGRLMFMSILTGMVAVGGRLQLGEVGKGTGRARLCAYVKHSTLKLCNRTGIARSEGGGQDQRNKLFLGGFCPRQSLHSKGSDKIKKR